MYDKNLCQNPKKMIEYGVISRHGPRDNYTDCEADVILIHIPSGTAKRFHGTWWDGKYGESMCDWILTFPKSDKGVTVDSLLHYQTCNVMDLI